MVGEEDLTLCLGWRTAFDPSISDSSDQLPAASDSTRDPCTEEDGDRIQRGGEREEKSQGKDSDEEEGGGVGAPGVGIRKKLRLSKEQASILEDAFRQHHTLNPKQKLELAKELNLRPRQVEVWFQNMRARTKMKKTEVDCELLKRCCENLTEENHRLQRELLELRALKRPPPHVYMQAGGAPPTTTVLAICPACEGLPHPGRPWRTLRAGTDATPHLCLSNALRSSFLEGTNKGEGGQRTRCCSLLSALLSPIW